MEIHSYDNIGVPLASGNNARADLFACGHIVVTLANMRLAFSREDFLEFAETLYGARQTLSRRETEYRDWGLFY